MGFHISPSFNLLFEQLVLCRTSWAFLDAQCLVALVLTPLLCQALPSVSAAVFPLLTDHNSYFSSTVTVAKIPSFRRVLNSINSQ